jgi:hypothetical protein
MSDIGFDYVNLESAEENVEQDDAMEKSDVDNDETTNSYVSCYPNTRRYSLANAMATNRPLYRTDNQGYSVDFGAGDGDDDEKEKSNNHGKAKETKINMPPSQPPQYSSVHEKMADKKVKVCREIVFFARKSYRQSFDFLSQVECPTW